MNNKSNGIGCTGLIIFAILLAVLIQYWYVFLAIAVLAGALWYYNHQQEAAKAAQRAKDEAREAETERQQAATASQADRIRQFKQLLDEGAITQAEFDKQKHEILRKDDHDLDF